MIEVTIRGISMTEAGFVVLLYHSAQERTLPIAPTLTLACAGSTGPVIMAADCSYALTGTALMTRSSTKPSTGWSSRGH